MKEGKNEVIKEMKITQEDGSDKMNVTVMADKDEINVKTTSLIDALAADNLLKKDNYSLVIKKGIVSVDGNELKEDAAAKYKTMVDALGGADIELKNTQK